MESLQKIFKSALRQWLMTRPVPEIRTLKAFGIQNISIGTTLGMVRKDNQDRAIIAKFKSISSENKTFILFALADGMGGMADGEKCASLLLSTLLVELINSKIQNPLNKLCAAAAKSNEDIYKEYKGEGGATLSAILFDSTGGSSAINVGDSRIYQIDDNDIFKQISVDDTIDGQLIAMKKEPSGLFGSNHLVQYVGMGEGMEPQEVKLSSPRSKIKNLLITSDGAHCVGDNVIESMLKNSPNASVFNSRLLALSQWIGGKDNATSICVFGNQLNELFNKNGQNDDLIQVASPQGYYDFPNCINLEIEIKNQCRTIGVGIGAKGDDLEIAGSIKEKNAPESNLVTNKDNNKQKPSVNINSSDAKKNEREKLAKEVKPKKKRSARKNKERISSDEGSGSIQIELFQEAKDKEEK